MAIEVESSVKITIGNQVVTLSGSEARELHSQLGQIFGLVERPIKYPLHEYWGMGKEWLSVPASPGRIICTTETTTTAENNGLANTGVWSNT